MSLRLPDPFVGRRDEKAITKRMAEIRDQVNDLLEEGWEAWRCRRGPRPPRGRDEAHVASQGKENKAVRRPGEGEPVVPRGTGPDDQENEDPPPSRETRTPSRPALMTGRLARETDEGKKIAAVLDNARLHHAKALTDLYAPDQALERITPIYMPPLWTAGRVSDSPESGLSGLSETRPAVQSRPSPTSAACSTRASRNSRQTASS